MKKYLDINGLGYLFGKINTSFVKKSDIPVPNSQSWYGIEWSDNSVPTRIGDTSLHISLPIQNQMRRCVVKDDGSITGYINPNDYTKYTNGDTVNYTGTDGQVMVEIPEYYYDAYDYDDNGTIKHRLVLYPYTQRGKKSKKLYVGAYEGSIASDKLCSVSNATFSVDSGTGNTVWESGALLPTTGRQISVYRADAKARGNGWSQQYWDGLNAIIRLYLVEYCNFNTQDTFYSTTDSNGYKRGGLGAGVSTTSNWDANGYNPFIPCGITNTLVNTTGTIQTTYSYNNGTKTLSFTGTVPSYRGVENPWGHIWKFTDGIAIYGNNTDGKSSIYTCDDITKFTNVSDSNSAPAGYVLRTDQAPYGTSGYISKWFWDINGDFIPSTLNGTSASDYSWFQNAGWKLLISGGYAYHGSICGWFCFSAHDGFSYSVAYLGGRLFYTPESVAYPTV